MKMQPDECFGSGASVLCMALPRNTILVHKKLSAPGPGRAQTVTGRPDRPRTPARECPCRRVLCVRRREGAEEGLGHRDGAKPRNYLCNLVHDEDTPRVHRYTDPVGYPTLELPPWPGSEHPRRGRSEEHTSELQSHSDL